MAKLLCPLCLVSLVSLAAIAAAGPGQDGKSRSSVTAEVEVDVDTNALDDALEQYRALRASFLADHVSPAGGQGGAAGDGAPVGACCDLGTGACMEGLTFCECVAAVEMSFWTEGQTCAEAGCPPLGSCCIADICTDDVGLFECGAMGGSWSSLPCSEVACPPFFPGACCMPETGECTDDVDFSECLTMGGIPSFGLTCADVDCPPIIPVGACCNIAEETCTPELTLEECGALGGVWSAGLACEDVACPPVGACCDAASGVCTDMVSEADCAEAGGLWFEGRACAEIECPGNTSCGLTDPSFETGGLSPWITEDLFIPFFPITAGGSGVQSWPFFFASEPTDGSFALLNGFDGSGPGTIRAAQDVDLPEEARFLVFDYRAAWDLASFCANEDRTFSVSIQPFGGGEPLETHLILTAQAGTIVEDTGNRIGLIDVGAYAGTSIRISFEWFVSEAFSGPAFFQLDNLRCDGKIMICHRPPGNPGNARTIEVSLSALPAHLRHGDTIGPCEEDGD
jgi:hypothetical protein